ncbi:MAG: RHS repeat-associated core domain-containing protein [Acidobacteriota bacterium]
MISTTGSGTEIYAYDPNNQRVYRRQPTLVEHYTLYGMKGERLGIYKPALYGYETVKLNFYFGGRLIREGDTAIVTNHVGTVVNNGPRLYPYGEAQSGAASGEKFATYYRDSTTALDYARNRYYSSTLGRFLTVDPLGESGKPDNPQSWHRYTYGQDDPVNQNDPSGLIAPGEDSSTPEPCFIAWSVPMGLRQCGDQFDPFPFLRYAIKAWPAPFVPPPTVAGGGGGNGSSSPPSNPSQPSDETVGFDAAWWEAFFDDLISVSSTWTTTSESLLNNDGCLNQFFRNLLSNANPYTPGIASTAGEIAGPAYSAMTFNRALQHAMTTSSERFGTSFLVYPFKSSTFRALLNQSKAGSVVGLLVTLDAAAAQALYSEYQSMKNGGCH